MAAEKVIYKGNLKYITSFKNSHLRIKTAVTISVPIEQMDLSSQLSVYKMKKVWGFFLKTNKPQQNRNHRHQVLAKCLSLFLAL